MPAYLLTYNPSNWHWENLPDLAQAVAAGGVMVDSWSTGATKRIRAGDRIFLLKQGTEPRGIMGSGFAQVDVYEDKHWDGSDGVANYVKVEFDALLNPEEQPILSRSALDDPALAAQHWDPMGSGASIKPEVLPALEQMWHEHLTSLGLTPSDQVILPARREEFARLYQAFLTEYPDTAAGRNHVVNYELQREIGRANWETIVEMDARGEDITDAVLWRLLPHIDSENTRRAGAWVHLAPAINKDVKSWFEGAGWTRAEDWPMVARAIFEFIRKCTNDPDDLAEACATFDALPQSKGFQAGMLTPILNALDPEHFALFNSKTRRTLKYFSGAKYEAALNAYPAANEALHILVDALAPDIVVEQAPDLRTDDLFDMFSHWLVAERKYDFDATRYWKIAPGEQARLWQDSLDGQYISIGWEELGDIRDMTRKDFERQRDAVLGEHSEWTAHGIEQVWKFAHIPEGDHIVANRGTSQVLGFGRVTGPYYFVPDVEHGHRLPVAWEDTTPRSVDEYGWRRTLIELNRSVYDDLLSAPAIGGTPPDVAPAFGPRAEENDVPLSPTYTLEQCADDTGYDVTTLQRWVNAIERKKQAILYGPPGTGKTFMAQKLANHLVGNATGHVELIQLHPAYAYEDFIQGLRPIVNSDGALEYSLAPGRFMGFCKESLSRGDAPSVLILDEINRANLARVFGELMYLLEYRGESIPLAAGERLSIPKNVRIIGTMNTADRSIALVDHALRRRFAFIELAPNFDTLLNFHAEAGLRLGGLIDTLRRLNHDVADPHYFVGVTFFMVDDLPRHIADIWRMEIEPYLDEYFFAQRDKAAAYNWERVADAIGLTDS